MLFYIFVLGLKVWCVFYTYRTTDMGLVTAKSLVTTRTTDYWTGKRRSSPCLSKMTRAEMKTTHGWLSGSPVCKSQWTLQRSLPNLTATLSDWDALVLLSGGGHHMGHHGHRSTWDRAISGGLLWALLYCELAQSVNSLRLTSSYTLWSQYFFCLCGGGILFFTQNFKQNPREKDKKDSAKF